MSGTEEAESAQTAMPLLLGGFRRGQLNEILALDVTTNQWRRMSLTLPYKVYDHGAAYLKGEAYIFGGFDGRNYFKCAYKLKENLEWEKLPDMIEERGGIARSSVVFDGAIWVVGGSNGRSQDLRSVEAYDPETDSWSKKPEMNTERSLAAAAVVKRKLFVCGGFNLSTVEYFDLELSKWTVCTAYTMPAPRCEMASAVVHDSILMVMGGAGEDNTAVADVWRINLEEDEPKWTSMPLMNSPRKELSALTIGDKIMVAGGFNSGWLQSVEVFDGNEWKEGPSMPKTLFSMTAISVPQELGRRLLDEYSTCST